MSDNTDTGTTGTPPAKPTPTQIVFKSLPRILFAWPLVILIAMFGVLTLQGACPMWLNGYVLFGVLIMTITVREFDFRTYGHLMVGLAILVIGSTGLWALESLPNRNWFAVSGQASMCIANALGVVILTSFGLHQATVRIDKRGSGFTLQFRGKEYLFTGKVKIIPEARDVAESILLTAGTRVFGAVKIVQPKEDHVAPFELTIEGVISPKKVVELIKGMINPPAKTA